MPRVLCPAAECVHNKNNRCTAKEVSLRQWEINTMYEGRKTMWECKAYELSDEFKEFMEKFRRHVSDIGQKERMG